MSENSLWLKIHGWLYRILAILKIGIAAAAIVVLCYLIPVIKQAGLMVSSTNQQVEELGKFVNDDPRGIKGTFALTNSILVQVGLAADQLRVASQKQSDYWDKTEVQLRESVAKVNVILDSTNQTMGSLNTAVGTINSTVAKLRDETVPASTETLVALQKTVTALQGNAAELVTQSADTLKSVKLTLDTTNGILSKSNLDGTFKNVDLLTGHLNQAGANVEETTGYIRDMFKPTKQSFWKALVETYLPIGIKSFIPQRVIVQNSPNVVVSPPKVPTP
jgi:hypothetical protein